MPSQTLSWASFGGSGSQAADFIGVTHDTGLMTVRATLIADGSVGTGAIYSSVIDSGEVFTGGNLYQGTTANSALELDNGGGSSPSGGTSPSGDSDTISLRLDFTSKDTALYANAAQNVTFTISDIDRSAWVDQVRIYAYDENGQLTDVSDILITTTSTNLTIDHARDEITATGGGNVSTTNPQGAVTVTIPGPVTHIIIDYDNLSTGDQRVEISDIDFETVDVPICFTKGTRIRTLRGEVPVEDLRPGDLVLTADHGARPLSWTGSRTVPATGAAFAPIRIAKGTLGNDRDLMVSPEHRLLVRDAHAELLFGVAEVLVAARHLIDGRRIRQQPGGMVTYYHLLFDRHELIWAEGALCESYHPADARLADEAPDTRAEILALFPELAGSPDSYGPFARPGLKRSEAELLGGLAT